MTEFVRLCRSDDILAALEDFLPCFPHLCEKISSLENFAEKLSNLANVYILKDEDGKSSVGITCFYANDSEKHCGYITLIGIKSEYRRSGYGRALLKFTEQTMAELGMTVVMLEVDADNITAQSFYRQFGFSVSRTLENGYYMTKEVEK